ncbi:N-acetylmuramoyl-L-alanine amidase [Nocardia aurea]|uniref:N-acetylmuramoyl-L-alanine amidase n=1 Tax=Nocardia aurea TaxID=2144174 RepID=UPI001E63BC51|nr:peptidoglycan recognition family protein [Nocardia aurea]
MAYLQSRWDSHGGRPSTDGGYGPMHLVDLGPARQAREPSDRHASGDARGDDARPAPGRDPVSSHDFRVGASPPGGATLRRAARLTGLPAGRLRADPAANLRGGAAILASYQRRPSADPADWYDAVARYSGSRDPFTARQFADEVFAVIREGAARRTDDGFTVRLAALPHLPAPAGPPLRRAQDAECPETLPCEWLPAAYERTGSDDYGNHDRLDGERRVDYIVIHDTEGAYGGIKSMVTDPDYVSWHYTVRSRDGHVAQHVRTKDVAWHAGNWDVNTRSIGIEHEGYLAKGGTWYTEAMYRASAELVKHLAGVYDIPIDRGHVLGHDNVPGTSPQTLPSMHDDPGPYWDWAHYFELLGHPIPGALDGEHEDGKDQDGEDQDGTDGEEGEDGSARRAPVRGHRKEPASVVIHPDYGTNLPRFTGCLEERPARACDPHGASTVWLRTEPRDDAPLIDDIGKRVGKSSTYSVYDHSARASTGQRFAVAGTRGDWTAIWYLGRKAWFHNPPERPTAVPAGGPLVTPVRDQVRVYGRAFPGHPAYRGTGVPYQDRVPLPYVLRPGQSYALGHTLSSSYLSAGSYRPARHVTVKGEQRYHQIQLGHRVMFVKAKDVRVIR